MTCPPSNDGDAVTAWLRAAGVPHRRVAAGEWGVALDDVAGAPLEVGIRVADGLLAAQAWVAPAGALDPAVLLHRHRRRPLVRYGQSLAGDVHVHGELPLAAVDAAWLDRLLAALVEAAELARQAASRRARSR